MHNPPPQKTQISYWEKTYKIACVEKEQKDEKGGCHGNVLYLEELVDSDGGRK